MKLGIVGGGTVGRATARCFMEHHEVRVHDVDPNRATHKLHEVLDCDLVFVCLPTPQKAGSLECDTSYIDSFFALLRIGADVQATKNFVLRSTVPIGTTNRLRERYRMPNLVHSPEFLTARCSVTDAQVPARNIIGVPNWPIMAEDSNRCYPVLYNLYNHRFPGIKTFDMTSDESEAVKLFLNGFFAVKVAYFNEVRCLADKLGLDWDRVIEGMMSDGRIAHSHTKVPGPDGKRGFGGACLPKDLASLVQCMMDAKTPALVASNALLSNSLVKETS